MRSYSNVSTTNPFLTNAIRALQEMERQLRENFLSEAVEKLQELIEKLTDLEKFTQIERELASQIIADAYLLLAELYAKNEALVKQAIEALNLRVIILDSITDDSDVTVEALAETYKTMGKLFIQLQQYGKAKTSLEYGADLMASVDEKKLESFDSWLGMIEEYKEVEEKTLQRKKRMERAEMLAAKLIEKHGKFSDAKAGLKRCREESPEETLEEEEKQPKKKVCKEIKK